MSDLKLAMVVSLVDKLTAPAKKLQRSVAGVTGKFGDSARSARRLSEQAGRLRGAFRRAASSISASMRKINWGAWSRRGALALGGLASAAAYGFQRTFVETATKFEKFETVLETIEGSSEKARQSMRWVSDFAAKTPYEMDQVNDAFVKLRAYGMDPTTGLMRSLGDTASAMGKPIMQAVEAIADAVTGENERLKEFGIKARAAGDKIVYEYTVDGQTQTAAADKSDRAAIESTLRGIFDSKFAGAMEKQSQTFGGMLSNLSDQWTRFQQMVMSSGVFDWMKERLGGVLDTLNRMAADGSLQEIADKFGQRLIDVFDRLAEAAKFVWPILRGIGETIWGIVSTLGGGGTAAVLGGVFAVGPITQFAAGLRGAAAAATAAGGEAAASVSRWTKLGGALKTAGGFLAGLSWPAIAVGAAVAAAGVLIWKYWDRLAAFFGGLWAGFVEGMQPAIEALEPLWSGLRKVWDWATQLLAPVEASEEQLAGWSDAGKTVGRILGAVVGGGIESVIAVVKTLVKIGRALVEYNPLVMAARAIYENWDDIAGAMERGRTAIQIVFFRLGKWLKKFWAELDFGAVGKALIGALAAGIKGSLNLLYEALKFVLGPLGKLLPSSDAKEGPLSQLTAAGASILDTMGAGVRSAGADGLRRPLAGALAGVVLAAPSFGAAAGQAPRGAGGGVTYNITIHQRAGEDARALVDRVIAAIEERRGAAARGALYDA